MKTYTIKEDTHVDCVFCGESSYKGDTVYRDDDGDDFCSKTCLIKTQYTFNPVQCPLCFGTGEFLGILGNLVHFRCEDCGTEFNQKI